MYRSVLVDKLVTHVNTKGFGLTSLSGFRRGFMPLQLKTKTKQSFFFFNMLYLFQLNVLKLILVKL